MCACVYVKEDVTSMILRSRQHVGTKQNKINDFERFQRRKTNTILKRQKTKLLVGVKIEYKFSRNIGHALVDSDLKQ